MARIERFEDIESWKLAREATGLIYDATASGEFSRDFALRDQIRRSAISTMSNIAEGFEREGTREFLSFLSIAKGSCAESRSQLYIAFDRGYMTQAEFERVHGKLQETGKLIGGFMRYLANSPLRGSKFATRNSTSKR